MSTTAKEGLQYGGSDGGGAGGKFQKRIFRKKQRNTPYDRPPSIIAANNGSTNNRSNGWLSKIVDPASKLITASAYRLFGTVFRKSLGPAPSPPAAAPHPQAHLIDSETKQESVEKLYHASSNENISLEKRPDLQQQNITEGGKPCANSENSGFLELEQMLKEKTFLRSEIDHLTSLLHSRTLSMTSPYAESSRSEEKFALAAFHKIEESAKSPLRENGMQYLKSYGIASTPINSTKERTHFIEEDVASPSDLAKAYMGNRSSKVYPSNLGLRSEAFREETPLPNNVPFTPKPPSTSLVSKVRVLENGYMTPRSRGRSAIYSMARTPYSRIPQASSQQGSVPKFDAFGGLSSSIQGRLEGSRPSSSRQVALKRGSYVLDSDIGTVDPIRRIRQKHSLFSANSLSLPVSGSPLSGTGTLSKLNKQGNGILPSTSFGSIPSQSSEMAQKILQQLDKLVPSKEKSSALKLTNARNESPASLTPDLLNAQARRSLEDVSFSKFLQNDRDTRIDGSPKTSSPHNFGSSQNQDKIEEKNSSAKHMDQSKRSTHSVNGVEAFVLEKDSIPISKSDDYIIANSAGHTPQKKWAFRMSAHEEFMDQDTDCYSNGTPTTSLAEKGENLDTGLVGSQSVSLEPVKVERPPVLSQGKPFTNSISNEKADPETLDGTVLAKKNTGFSFTVAPPATNMAIHPAITSPGTDSVKNIEPKESNSFLPVFNFSSNNVNKVPPVELPSTSAFGTYKGITPDASSHPKLSSSSSGFVCGDTANVTDEVDMFRKPENTLPSAASTASITTLEARDMFKKPETTLASTSSTSFSFGSPANNVPASNEALFSNSTTVSSPSPVLTFQSASAQTLAKSSTMVLESPAFTVSSASSNSSATTSTLPTAQTATMPSFASTFLSPVSKAPSGIESTDAPVETKQKPIFGNVSNSPFGATISSNASTGSSIFGFSASATTTTTTTTTTPVINPFMGSNPPGASSVSLGNSQPSIGTGASNFTSSVPVQIGSSTSFPTFAFGGTTTVASTSSLFSSSASPSTAKPFSSGASFGLSSSTSSSSTANAITAPTSSIFGSTPNTTAPTTTPVFSFGGAQASPAAPNNTSTNSLFPFTLSASNTSSSTSLAPSQSLFGNPNPASTFGNASGSNDQMSMEDTMAEDTVQASAVPSSVTTFGQSPISSSPASGFVFGSTPNPFQFGNQQSSATMQNPFQFGNQQISTPPVNQSPFQSSGSLDFNGGGGSFSLGTGGGDDKSNRRIVRVKRNARKK